MRTPSYQAILQDYTNLDIEKRIKRINEKLGIDSNYNHSLPSISEENSIDDKNNNFTRSKSEGANPPPTPSNQLRNLDSSLAHQVRQNANKLQEKGYGINPT
jgi:hypothetical protein